MENVDSEVGQFRQISYSEITTKYHDGYNDGPSPFGVQQEFAPLGEPQAGVPPCLPYLFIHSFPNNCGTYIV